MSPIKPCSFDPFQRNPVGNNFTGTILTSIYHFPKPLCLESISAASASNVTNPNLYLSADGSAGLIQSTFPLNPSLLTQCFPIPVVGDNDNYALFVQKGGDHQSETRFYTVALVDLTQNGWKSCDELNMAKAKNGTFSIADIYITEDGIAIAEQFNIKTVGNLRNLHLSS